MQFCLFKKFSSKQFFMILIMLLNAICLTFNNIHLYLLILRYVLFDNVNLDYIQIEIPLRSCVTIASFFVITSKFRPLLLTVRALIVNRPCLKSNNNSYQTRFVTKIKQERTNQRIKIGPKLVLSSIFSYIFQYFYLRFLAFLDF